LNVLCLIPPSHLVLTIPPGVMHGAINLSSETCVVVNAVLRHRPVQERDYVTRRRPFPYDLEAANQALKNIQNTIQMATSRTKEGGGFVSRIL